MSDEEKGYEPPGWLLTYGDMVTLLVTFFVMLISLSTINVDKYKKKMWKVQKTFAKSGGESFLKDGTIPLGKPFEDELDLQESFDVENYRERFEDFEDSYRYLSSFIKESQLDDHVAVEDIKIGCKIKISKDVCFERDAPTLKQEAYAILNELGAAIRKINGKVLVNANKEIFSKDRKGADLSIERAADICDFLKTNAEIEPQRLAISRNGINSQHDEDTIEVIVLRK